MGPLANPSLPRGQCLIDGVWRGRADADVLNPATGEVVGAVPTLDAEGAVEAVEAASRAFDGWAGRLAKDRAQVLKRWHELLVENRDDFAPILTSEQGKPLAEARGEVDYAAAYVEFHPEEGKRVTGETLPSHRHGAQVIMTRQPVGVVAAITPWNFSAAMITRKIAPAMAAGCTVVVKPAPETPLTALALAGQAEQAGVPAGVLNVVTGGAQAIGGVLTGHPAVRVVSLTGSTAVGKTLMRQCAGTVKRVALELGGNAPVLVFDDADLDAAVEGVMFTKFRNMGQTCVCANRIYVQFGIHNAFLGRLVDAVGRLRVGNGMDEGVGQGPLIKEAAVDKVRRHVSDALGKGARLHVGGRRHELGNNFFEPTVLSGSTSDMAIATEETFGPVAAVFRFYTEDEAVAAANATEYGSAATSSPGTWDACSAWPASCSTAWSASILA